MMIIDIHAHVGQHPLMEFKQTVDEVLSDMGRWGIDRTFIMPFPNMKNRKMNEFVAEAVGKYGDRLTGLANINPAADDALEEFRYALGLGLKGLMLDPEFHGVFGRAGSKVEELAAQCLENGLPVLFNTPNIETGEADSMGRDPYYQGLKQLAFKFPQVPFLVNTYWPRVKELMGEFPNIYIDTGGRNGISGGLRLAQDISPTRVCFGSESPQNHPALGIKAIRTMKCIPAYRELVLGKNAERIFCGILP